ncbi:hypothetical protein NEOLEDRAFT_1057364 [Neolentinus lepideus HHB14362 ss-1]|uniref:Uncharacterized protein n=1 Tax=Neolentinus lepideus HHB14362 ss-1 TaxID=1314782 RepID=A0A165V0S6_9AGAM|nr:hypothetical protein NEOLEDRAFT_1057364 [Neolentinus lepideus HHB14362 ss-1]
MRSGVTVDSLITHTGPWMSPSMGYCRVWVAREVIKISLKYKLYIYKNNTIRRFYNIMNESMGYGILQRYGLSRKLIRNQLGGRKNVWVRAEYGLLERWVMRESTVQPLF